jgi:hypothetical protein
MVSGVEKIFSVVEMIISVTKTMVKIDRRANRNKGNGLTGL